MDEIVQKFTYLLTKNNRILNLKACSVDLSGQAIKLFQIYVSDFQTLNNPGSGQNRKHIVVSPSIFDTKSISSLMM